MLEELELPLSPPPLPTVLDMCLISKVLRGLASGTVTEMKCSGRKGAEGTAGTGTKPAGCSRLPGCHRSAVMDADS